MKEIKDKFEIKIENGKECIEIVTTTTGQRDKGTTGQRDNETTGQRDKGPRIKDKKYLELPQLPKEFKNKKFK
jgi:hypothetical protein